MQSGRKSNTSPRGILKASLEGASRTPNHIPFDTFLLDRTSVGPYTPATYPDFASFELTDQVYDVTGSMLSSIPMSMRDRMA